MSTQLASMTTSYDADLPMVSQCTGRNAADDGLQLPGAIKPGRATSTQSVGAEFYFKDVLFTQETPEFIL